MKQSFYFVAFVLLSLSAAAQTTKLKPGNPAPRAGEELEISYTVQKDDEPPSELDLLLNSKSTAIAHGSFKTYLSEGDTGNVTFGPFTFRVNGKAYVSDMFTIRVDAALPSKTEGVWIRRAKWEGKDLLVLEQRIPGKWENESTGKFSSSTSFVTRYEEFAEIDPSEIEEEGLSLTFKGSYTYSQEVTVKGKEETVSYKRSVYEVIKEPGFKGVCRLRKKHFKNFPRGTDFDGIVID